MVKFLHPNSDPEPGDLVVGVVIRRTDDGKCYVPRAMHVCGSGVEFAITEGESISEEDDLPAFLARVTPQTYTKWRPTRKMMWLVVLGDERSSC
jgi:hypothetical protein